ncbi:putative flagellar associated, related protein [Toxoplasma gondii GAB2-2007-GAL-DOM2]|uniref:Putative flagellar associated, related protein n=1 Tax=Toxoplasma gondii GAB2-2007-GAL-DOM2 TaxID=1130820 RepID=A0A086JEB1_TOXGO|nr:putative flagellar associated, related protein [Toxoplasma gondii GAB2-2007-GAL-DOM2]
MALLLSRYERAAYARLCAPVAGFFSLEFQKLSQSYRATLRLVGPLTRQSVELRGRGIRAEMVVSPPDRDLDFGAVFVPSQPGKGSPPHAPAALCPAWTYKVLTVRNPASSCVLRFRVECLFTSHSAVETCGARRSFAPFACWPLQGEILPGASQQFCLAFRPSKEGTPSKSEVGNKRSERNSESLLWSEQRLTKDKHFESEKIT